MAKVINDPTWGKFTLHRALRMKDANDQTGTFTVAIVPPRGELDWNMKRIKGGKAGIKSVTFDFPIINSLQDVEKLEKVMPNLFDVMQSKLASHFLGLINSEVREADNELTEYTREQVLDILVGRARVESTVSKWSTAKKQQMLAALQAELQQESANDGKGA